MRRLLAAALAAFLCLPVHAQTDAGHTVRGRVVDALTGRAVADAEVVLSARDGAASRTVRTDASGRYVVDGLQPGRYSVAVEASGYQPALSMDVRTLGREVVVANFSLAPPVGQLAEVSVTTDAIAADPLAGVSTVRLDREEIRRSPGTAGDVFRGLDSLPGVGATGAFANFSVRGNDPRDNRILVDGIPFDKVVHFDTSFGEQEAVGGGGRFSIFAPNLIGSAEFQPGGWRAAYGGRKGSLLRLDIAEPATDVAVASAQIAFAGPEIAYEGPSGVHDGTAVLFSARHLDFERLFEAIDNEDLGAPSLSDVILKTVTRLSDAHQLEFLAIHAPEKYTRDVEDVLASEDYEDTFLARTEQDSSLVGLTWRWYAGATAQISNTLYWRDSERRSSQGEAFPDLAPPNPAVEDVPVRTNILRIGEGEREYGWRGDVSLLTHGEDVLTFGARVTRAELDFTRQLDGDWIRYVYDRDDFRADPGQRYIVLTPSRYDTRFEARDTRASAYADYAWRRGSVTVTPGIRYDRDGFTSESLVSPRLSLLWQAAPGTRAWLGGGVYYQAPRYFELAGDALNAGLRSERSKQVAVGVTHELGERWRLQGEAWHQELDRLVVMPDRTSGVARNTGEGESSGLDLSMQRRMSENWSAGMSYSYLRARRDDGIGGGRYDADFDRPHIVTLFGAWEPSPAWAFSAKWKYLSGRPRDAFIVHADVHGDPAFVRYSQEFVTDNTDRYPGFHTLNVRIDYRRKLGPVDLVAFADIINVYAHENVDSREWDPRRGIVVQDGLSVLPNVGVKFEYSWTP